MRKIALILMTVALFSPFGATRSMAGEPDVVAVEVAALPSDPGMFRFSVTVRHGDTGWEHYADGWEVVAPDGRVLGRRELLHPHVGEQPFTRGADIRIPPEIGQVTVRAHDNVHGLGGQVVSVTVPHGG
jgi:hypothetical protein